MVKQVDCGNAACEAVTLDKWCGFSGPTPRRISYIGLYLHTSQSKVIILWHINVHVDEYLTIPNR